MPKDGGIGASTVRREDIRFLTGKGRYTADINLRGQAYAVFLRSEVAHGRINGIDTAAAKAMPGVLAIMTGEDFVAMGGNPAGWYIPSRDGTAMKEPKRPVLAHGKVRHVGDAYAIVVAETPEQAKDAAASIEADITELPAIVDMAQAVADNVKAGDVVITMGAGSIGTVAAKLVDMLQNKEQLAKGGSGL